MSIRAPVSVLLIAFAAFASHPARGSLDDPASWEVGPLPPTKVIGTSPVTLRVKQDQSLRKILARLASDDSSRITLRLNLNGIEPVGNDSRSKAGIRVYVNSPDDDPTPAAADSVYYVGMVTPLGKKEASDYSVDLAPTLRKLAAKGLWRPDKPLVIRLVAAPVNPKTPAGEVKFRLERVVIESPREPE